MLKYETSKLTKINYTQLSTVIKDEEQSRLFEKFFAKLLETLHMNSNFSFKTESKVTVQMDLQKNEIVVLSQTKNTLSVLGALKFTLCLPTEGLAIKKNLLELYNIKSVFVMVYMNWEQIVERINKNLRENSRSLIDQPHEGFSNDFRLLLGLIDKSKLKKGIV